MTGSMVIAAADVHFEKIIVACSLLLGLLILLYVGVNYYRKHLIGDDEDSPVAPFTLADLRILRDRGDITEDEYNRTRAVIIGQVRGDLDDPGPEVSDNADRPKT